MVKRKGIDKGVKERGKERPAPLLSLVCQAPHPLLLYPFSWACISMSRLLLPQAGPSLAHVLTPSTVLPHQGCQHHQQPCLPLLSMGPHNLGLHVAVGCPTTR